MIYALTPRQRQIIDLRAAGLPIKAVARELGISPNTVKNASAAAYRKLGVETINGAMTVLGMYGSSDPLVLRMIDIEEEQHRERLAFLRALLETP